MNSSRSTPTAGVAADAQPTQAAVIVAIPAADPAVSAHRRALDAAAALGVPAHVTVIFPFAVPAALTRDDDDRLASAIRSVPRFECSFSSIGWFGQDCAWLRPDDDRPFRALTLAVWAAFPDHPPYGGAFDDLVPHLTIGERRLGTLQDLHRATTEVMSHLPISQHVSEVVLVAGTEAVNSWSVVRRFPLG